MEREGVGGKVKGGEKKRKIRGEFRGAPKVEPHGT